jgi:GNAT superfamily N-acetyltransferase
LNDFSINHVDLNVSDIGLLLEESLSEGHRHIQRLVKDYHEGENRFNGTGEALFGVNLNGRVIAICGLNRDPYTKNQGIGRIRRLYVLKRYRRNGIAKKLMEVIIEQARMHYKTLTLFTDNPIADNFYGFTKSPVYQKSTHYLRL